MNSYTGWVRWLSQSWREFDPKRWDGYGYGAISKLVGEEVTGRAEEESVVISKAAKEAGMYSPLLDDTKYIIVKRNKRQL